MEISNNELYNWLPDGWQELAKTTGALTRSREIKTAEDLLYLNFLYLTEGKSYGMTAALLNILSGISMTKRAVKNRILKSSKWLKAMTLLINQNNGFVSEKPTFLGDRNLILVDGSSVCQKGSVSSDYLLHYAFNLFDHTFSNAEITSTSDGEKLSRYAFSPNDIVVADRAYGTITGIECVKQQGANFCLRLRTKCFKLYNEQKEEISLEKELKMLKEWESKEINCFYLNKGIYSPIRIVAVKKDAEMSEEARKKTIETARRKQATKPSKESLEMSNYLVLATSLSYTKEQVVEIYRARWQVEMVFKELKSIFKFGEIPTKTKEATLAYLYGKLFIASIVQSMYKEANFSPQAK